MKSKRNTQDDGYVDDEEEEELDLTYIDVEEEEDFKNKPAAMCKDSFLNTLCGDCDDYIPGLEDDDEDGDGSDIERDNMEMGHQSDEEDVDGVGVEYVTHDPSVKWNKMKPFPGERYESPKQLKLCITNYAISNGYHLRFSRCDSIRIVVTCGGKSDKKPCPFRIWASWMSTERSFQIKRMVDKHKCVRNFNNASLMSPTWLARQFLKELIRKPNLKCTDMQAMIQSKFHCEVSWARCYRAKCRAMSLIEGKLSDHYGRVWDYANELLRSNPGSTIKVCVTVNPDEITYFHRMYICFKAIKDGWKRGCRRVIGLDGCFLKGQCKGELLTAIGRDANNQVYPIAWAVVDIENKANWKWFMELLEEDLGLQGGRGLCIISDQHKGLLESTKEILPYVEHRQCARHIYANFRKVYSGLEFRNMFWAAATSTVEGEFLENMEKIKGVSQAAYEHLQAREPKTWCRAYFGTSFACDAVENGIAECFNSIILEARKKPLITMLEEIRLYMMNRFYRMLLKAEKWEGDVCPAAVKKMTKFALDIRNWYVCPSGTDAYETKNGYESYTVNLRLYTCSCRMWDISGIPCVHAQASIYFTHQAPAGFISVWFSKQKFKETYAENLQPVNGSKLWAATPYTKPLPPIARRMPGRPSVKRRRHISESDGKYYQVSRARTGQCTNCQQKGHNKVSCRNPAKAPEPKAKKKLGRPRLDPDVSHWTRGGHRGPRVGARGRGGGARGRGGGARGGGSSGRGGGSTVRGRGRRGGGSSVRGEGSSVRGITQAEMDDYLNVQDVPVEQLTDSGFETQQTVTGNPFEEGESEDFSTDEEGESEEINTDEEVENEEFNNSAEGVPETQEPAEFVEDVAVEPAVVEPALVEPAVVEHAAVESAMEHAAVEPAVEHAAAVVEPALAAVEPAVVAVRSRVAKKVVIKRRKPSERILKNKLTKMVVTKDGTGSAVKPYEIE